ncbi:MAG: hypothetical protein IJE70_02415 [Oscillospiraceae bacterium]|nr:hypothetical protein [Oscillospiraceae bacterium]
MIRDHRTYFFFSIAIIGIIALVLLLLFVPDMSTTIINTVPEYPPEIADMNPENDRIISSVTVSRENVRNIISALNRPEEYFEETQSVLSHKNGDAVFSRQKWVKGALSRVDIMSASRESVSIHYIYNNTHVFIWKPHERTYYKTSRGSFSADDAQMMMSYEDIISANDEDIISAQLTMYDGVPCIYTEVKNSTTGYTERYWVSHSTGLLIYGQTLDDKGDLIYTITSTQTDISPQDSEIFRLPDGSFPEQ